jgi:hypothetical protein
MDGEGKRETQQGEKHFSTSGKRFGSLSGGQVSLQIFRRLWFSRRPGTGGVSTWTTRLSVSRKRSMELSAGRGKGGGIARQKKEGVSYPTVIHLCGFLCMCMFMCTCVWRAVWVAVLVYLYLYLYLCLRLHPCPRQGPKSIFIIFSSRRLSPDW